MGKLMDKNILITGGNSGIGLAAAQEFDREGARRHLRLECGIATGS
jgi:NAD(P)-dependent dehydrogenase (short-subunit alcohol dehydrogenase family)